MALSLVDRFKGEDASAKGCIAFGERAGHARLSNTATTAIAAIRARLGPRGAQLALAREHGVSRGHISRVASGAKRRTT